MSLFKKEPPKACPKCGSADAWRCVTDDIPQSHAEDAGLGNPFYFDTQRDPFYHSMGDTAPKTKVHYRCDNCGYEMSC